MKILRVSGSVDKMSKLSSRMRFVPGRGCRLARAALYSLRCRSGVMVVLVRRLGGQLILCVGRCRVRSLNHVPGSRSSFLRFLLKNHHYQNRSGGVEETGCMEFAFLQ